MTATSSTTFPVAENPASPRSIRLRGVQVNNLKGIDLDIPHGQLLCFCGLSGSGKTSLAIDTLFAEGQRRYIECFSPFTRQFLKQWDKPNAKLIDGIPPAIAVTSHRVRKGSRATIGSVTETTEYLKLLFARVGKAVCPDCDLPVRIHSPQSIAHELNQREIGTRFQITFPIQCTSSGELETKVADLRASGFRRLIVAGRIVEIDNYPPMTPFGEWFQQPILVVVDRLVVESSVQRRTIESLETAMRHGSGAVVVLAESAAGSAVVLEGRSFEMLRYQDRMVCSKCHREFQPAEPILFSHNSPRGACLRCHGLGNRSVADLDKIVPNKNKSIRDGAIAPWNVAAWRHELERLIEIAPNMELPLDIPFHELASQHLELLWNGDKTQNFGGLNGFLDRLRKQTNRISTRVFLSSWTTSQVCDSCHGGRLNSTALAWKIGDRNIAELTRMPIDGLSQWIFNSFPKNNLVATDVKDLTAEMGVSGIAELVNKVQQRLGYLIGSGLGYLSLDRYMASLGNGERQRVALTRALGSSLVNLLYVLDEPSSGLHPFDIERLIPQIRQLQSRRNTVVMVEHNPRLIEMADRIVEIGPAAGQAGGEIIFDGSPDALIKDGTTATGAYLSGKRGWVIPEGRRTRSRGSMRLSGARGNNLKSIDVSFPLGMLCVVTGVSGAGKSSLVRQTLAPAVQGKKGTLVCESPLPFDELRGSELVDEVVLIDRQSLIRTSRSNPATWIRAFDEIRNVFASTPDAKAKGITPGHFSFNVAGGRCETCRGEGFLTIDMQFMADVLKRCDECHGTRFQPRVREVRYRDRNISDVLNMTVDEAFGFFRGHKKVQKRLKLLKDAGLDYARLGQPLSTLSSGEAQRLHLASFLGVRSSKRTLFIMDEPTSGLHMSDVRRLLTSFNALIDVGHSIIVIEHNLMMIAWADHIIDLGPGPAELGGQVVATGAPEQICEVPQSVTGRYLKTVLDASSTS